MPGFNRRQLFRLRLRDVGREVTKIVTSPADGGEAEEERFPRPPGALQDEAAFLETCQRCHDCAGACPYDAIGQYGPVGGALEGTPFINPGAAPCHWCEDMPCIAACPSGALVRETEQPVPAMAKVALDLDRCLNRQGILCDTCSFRCPTDIRAIRMVQRMPVLDVEACTGCGMCVFHCEAKPSAFSLIFPEHADD
ncbi:MAG: 4Fe-4S dicluster domain-containing protein [Verrucomicrobiales bacterium]